MVTGVPLIAVRLDFTIADTEGDRRLDRCIIDVAPADGAQPVEDASRVVWRRCVALVASVLQVHREHDSPLGLPVYSVNVAGRPADLSTASVAERVMFASRRCGPEEIHAVATRIVRTCRLAGALPLRQSQLPASLGAGNVAAMTADQPLPAEALASFPRTRESILLLAEPSQVDAFMVGPR